MATFDIKTRDLGEIRFSCRDDGGYVRVSGGDIGEGRQPCDGGTFRGSTIRANADSLERVAGAWWKQFLRNRREHNHRN